MGAHTAMQVPSMQVNCTVGECLQELSGQESNKKIVGMKSYFIIKIRDTGSI